MVVINYSTETDTYFFKEKQYTGTHPYYYDTARFPWVQEFESKYGIILNEIAGLIYGKEEMPPNLNPPYLSSPDAWRNFYFMNFRWYNHKNCLKFPNTFALLQTIPNISFAGITVLEPHSKVLPHIGETNAIIRCHLGLKIPGNYLDCGIKVGDEERGYAEGKLIMFSDAHMHTTWNNTNERRFILVLDIIQPQFAHKSNWVCAKSLSALSIKFLDDKTNVIDRFPNFILKGAHTFFALFWFLYLPIQKQFGLYYKRQLQTQ